MRSEKSSELSCIGERRYGRWRESLDQFLPLKGRGEGWGIGRRSGSGGFRTASPPYRKCEGACVGPLSCWSVCIIVMGRHAASCEEVRMGAMKPSGMDEREDSCSAVA